jgi:hypothetical protein
MASRYSLRHIDISRLARVRDYQSTVSTPRARTIHRIREEHADRLANGIDDALAAGDERRAEGQGHALADGVYIEVELVRGAKAAKLERRSQRVQPGATVIDADTEMQRVALFVPDTARPALKQILEDYAHGPLTEKGNPPK